MCKKLIITPKIQNFFPKPLVKKNNIDIIIFVDKKGKTSGKMSR